LGGGKIQGVTATGFITHEKTADEYSFAETELRGQSDHQSTNERSSEDHQTHFEEINGAAAQGRSKYTRGGELSKSGGRGTSNAGTKVAVRAGCKEALT